MHTSSLSAKRHFFEFHREASGVLGLFAVLFFSKKVVELDSVF